MDSPAVHQMIQSAVQKTGAELLDTSVQTVVHQAAIGLSELHVQNGCPGGAELPADLQHMLNNFTQQQAQCYYQMQQIHAKPTNPTGPEDVSAPVGDFQMPRDSVSVHSSPGQAMKPSMTAFPQLPERYAMSPPGQRELKIPKSCDGSVHTQPKPPDKVPLPASPTDSRTPTPVPTEIADDEWQGPGGEANLQQLE